MSEGERQSQQDSDSQYLSFTLGTEFYGIDILRVQEIKGWEDVRVLPDTPDYLKGVLDLRGSIVPIIDLRKRFNLESVMYTPTTVTIVLTIQNENKQYVIGLVVDGVSDVLDVRREEVKSAPELGARLKAKYIKGIFKRGEKMIVILDVDTLFCQEDIEVFEEI